MSAKYQRVKQADLLLPAPLRWLTRAFSSITMAVVLLTMIAVYGTFASVPIAFIVRGSLYFLLGILPSCLAVVVGYCLVQQRWAWTKSIGVAGRWGLALMGLALAILAGVWGYLWAYDWTHGHEWFIRHQATVIYRLPYFEMTELEFYNWWPMKVILALFVLNMIWATIRRIEFKWLNIGVLTVHAGIVVVALASIFYGRFKFEGDTLLFRSDLPGGEAVNVFYDGTTPAIYFTHEQTGRNLMLELPELPRYNDYDPDANDGLGELDIRLHERPQFDQVVGRNLRATIRGFVSYGNLVPQWVDAKTQGSQLNPQANPAVRLNLGDEHGPQPGFEQVLAAWVPAARVMDQGGWSLEYLVSPPRRRLMDLLEEFDGPHGLIVEIPHLEFRETYAIEPGQTIQVGDTGYTLRVEQIGPYGLSFATPGYQGATDTRAMLHFSGNGKDFRRMAMHRYPERSQDFVPAPDDPSVGPMGRRVEPDSDIVLTYLDTSHPQFHLVADDLDTEHLRLLVRLPGQKPFQGVLHENRFPIGQSGGQQHWLYITERFESAMQIAKPIITPKLQRNSREEGTYLHSVLPVDLEVDIPDPHNPGQTRRWSHRVWLRHMRYPTYADDMHHPVRVMVPGVGPIQVAFSRQRHLLPFTLRLDDFEMIPYPGTDIPQDYKAWVTINSAPDGSGQTSQAIAHMNNPIVHQRIKLSQVGWDPGEKTRPDYMARDEHGRFINQQRFTILGVGNNVAIQIIFVGCCLIAIGIPWAFYVKPAVLRHQKRKIQQQLARGELPARPHRPQTTEQAVGPAVTES